jgi:hypothetical protein
MRWLRGICCELLFIRFHCLRSDHNTHRGGGAASSESSAAGDPARPCFVLFFFFFLLSFICAVPMGGIIDL